MKKVSVLLITLLFTAPTYIQAQRLVLLEEFTGENCPPCADFNPSLDLLLDANPSKIVSIKYQTNIPFGTPKLYDYNPFDVDAASFYYFNGGAPFGYIDGNAWTGPIGGFSQTIIDNRHTMPAPFSISVTHFFSSSHDTIFIRAIITATQAIAGLTKLRAKIAVTEKEITGFTAYNGEDHFRHVMRRLLPDAGGTALQADWAAGDTVVIEERWRIEGGDPTPDWAQLETVVFVQNDADREVLQTGFSPAFVTTNSPPAAATAIQLSVWPNPAVDFLTIRAEFGSPKNIRFSLMDIQGRSQVPGIRFTNVSTFNQKIHVSLLPKGVYFLKIAFNDEVIIRRILVE